MELINCKRSPTSSLILFTILFGSSLTIYRSTIYGDEDHELSSSFLRSASGFARERNERSSRVNPAYASSVEIDWREVSSVVGKIKDEEGFKSVGLLNFEDDEIGQWKNLVPDAGHVRLRLDHVPENMTWETLYPEWIDEEEETTVPKCPGLPSLRNPSRQRIELIAVKLPCHKSGRWPSDVPRLHLQLSAARLAASYSGSDRPVHVLLVSEYFPIPNLFTCRELVARDGSVWLYRPDLDKLRERVRLPVGSCELAVAVQPGGQLYARSLPDREAYATILHSAPTYVCGAIVAAQAIRMAGSTHDLVILVDDTISKVNRDGLRMAGWKVYPIQRIRNPKAHPDAYNEWNYSKFRLWQLTQYEKIVFIDADQLVLRNIDFLFQLPELSATGNNATLFNSGVMVIEPSNCTFRHLMDRIDEIESYNGGDQGYLNEVFTWWHRIPRHVNFLKHFWEGDSDETKERKTELFGVDPPALYVIHYLGLKPWQCFRDYDCNWNVDYYREFASDVAHERWWKLHDAMPEELQGFCMLSTERKVALERERRRAEVGNYTDGHWRIEIKDERLTTCIDDLCSRESFFATRFMHIPPGNLTS